MTALRALITRRNAIALAGAGSAAILLGALAFQFIGGLRPCPLCVYQRWPHVMALVLALAGLTLLRRWSRWVSALAALTILTGAGIALYHFGIEREWWQGPDTCTSGDITTLSTEQLMAQIMDAPLVRCDEIVWEFLSLTIAGWNAVISLGLAGLWLASALVPADRQGAAR